MKNRAKSRLSLLLCLLVSGIAISQQPSSHSLTFNPGRYEIQTLSIDGNNFKVRAYENIVYVSKPVDTLYQKINIYIPEAYFENQSVNGYTAATAPIFFPNRIGGYMPAKPATALPPKAGDPPGGMGGNQKSAIVVALSKGYIVASAGARGRTLADKNGTFTGKAPAVIVDLKAAVAYLKFNDAIMPGDAKKIISNGTSAGGALSVLVGATGNNSDYASYLKEIGAAGAPDDIFAVSAYCPITNLDHADMAYEWQFNGVNSYKKRSFPPANNSGGEVASLTEDQVKVSDQLKVLFPSYLNKLQIKDKNGVLQTLDANGNGNFKDLIKSYILVSAQKALDKGSDLSALGWLKIENGKVTDLDFESFVMYQERMKTPPAFDALDLSTPENQLFGNYTVDKQHFTEFSMKNATVASTLVDDLAIKMMNPLNYIGQPHTNTALHWRIRHGTKDRDTGLAIPVILGTCLQNKGFDVNLELPWDVPHSGDYDLDELFQWMDGISK